MKDYPTTKKDWVTAHGFWQTVDQSKLSTKLKNAVFGTVKKLFLKKADDERNGLGHAINRKHLVLDVAVELRDIFHRVDAARNDPEIGIGVIDHYRDHAPKSRIKSHLDQHEDDREHDADERRDETQTVMEKVAECEGQAKRHRSVRFSLFLRQFPAANVRWLPAHKPQMCPSATNAGFPPVFQNFLDTARLGSSTEVRPQLVR